MTNDLELDKDGPEAAADRFFARGSRRGGRFAVHRRGIERAPNAR